MSAITTCRFVPIAAALAVAAMISVPSTAKAQWEVRSTVPPLQGFFAKYIDCDGIPVRSSAAVDDEALQLACLKVSLMLNHIPAAHERLVQKKVELHIIGRDEQTSELPEFRARRGQVYTDNHGNSVTIDQRTRGMGGLLTSLAVMTFLITSTSASSRCRKRSCCICTSA